MLVLRFPSHNIDACRIFGEGAVYVLIYVCGWTPKAKKECFEAGYQGALTLSDCGR